MNYYIIFHKWSFIDKRMVVLLSLGHFDRKPINIFEDISVKKVDTQTVTKINISNNNWKTYDYLL